MYVYWMNNRHTWIVVSRLTNKSFLGQSLFREIFETFLIWPHLGSLSPTKLHSFSFQTRDVLSRQPFKARHRYTSLIRSQIRDLWAKSIKRSEGKTTCRHHRMTPTIGYRQGDDPLSPNMSNSSTYSVTSDLLPFPSNIFYSPLSSLQR